jgi:hypothetical protein
MGTVAAPRGSPAVPHLRRYYRVVRLLQHPSVLPPVDPWLHVPPARFQRRSSVGKEEMGSSLEFPASLCGTCPGLGTPPIPARPRNTVAPDIAFRWAKHVGIGTI